MRILLDNCVNHRFGPLVDRHEIVHVRHLGWADLTNGKLLSAAEEKGFQVLLTVDQNLRFQQNLIDRVISLVTLDARSITLAGLTPFVPALLEALLRIEQQGETGQNVLVSLSKAP